MTKTYRARQAAFLLVFSIAVLSSYGCGGGGGGNGGDGNGGGTEALSLTLDSPTGAVTINEGGAVTFQSTVNGGATPYALDWNFSGGATNSTDEDPGSITFSTSGAYPVTLTVTDNEGTTLSSSVIVTVEGSGSKTPNIYLSQSSIDFPGVVLGNNLDRTIVITNTGNENLSIGQLSMSNLPFKIAADTASNTTLAPAQTCSLSVRFSPTSQGTPTATLSIPSNDPDTPTASISLRGVGYGLNVWINKVSASCPSISVDVTVTDVVGNTALTSLTADKFKLYHNGQPVSGFDVFQIENPSLVSVALALDASKSLVGVNEQIHSAATAFINRLTGADQAAVCKFTEVIEFEPVYNLALADTAGKSALNAYINNYFDPGIGTALYDAVYQSVDRVAAVTTGKRAVIVFSDGSDSEGSGGLASDNSLNEAIAYAKTKGIPVFTIYFVDLDYIGGSRGMPDLMERLAIETGGQFYHATTADFDNILQQISNVLSNKYTLSYTPAACSGTISLDVRVDSGALYGQDSRTIKLP